MTVALLWLNTGWKELAGERFIWHTVSEGLSPSWWVSDDVGREACGRGFSHHGGLGNMLGLE